MKLLAKLEASTKDSHLGKLRTIDFSSEEAFIRLVLVSLVGSKVLLVSTSSLRLEFATWKDLRINFKGVHSEVDSQD